MTRVLHDKTLGIVASMDWPVYRQDWRGLRDESARVGQAINYDEAALPGPNAANLMISLLLPTRFYSRDNERRRVVLSTEDVWAYETDELPDQYGARTDC